MQTINKKSNYFYLKFKIKLIQPYNYKNFE